MKVNTVCASYKPIRDKDNFNKFRRMGFCPWEAQPVHLVGTVGVGKGEFPPQPDIMLPQNTSLGSPPGMLSVLISSLSTRWTERMEQELRCPFLHGPAPPAGTRASPASPCHGPNHSQTFLCSQNPGWICKLLQIISATREKQSHPRSSWECRSTHWPVPLPLRCLQTSLPWGLFAQRSAAEANTAHFWGSWVPETGWDPKSLWTTVTKSIQHLFTLSWLCGFRKGVCFQLATSDRNCINTVLCKYISRLCKY